ncbi:zinc-binding dehydrogenase [Chloroflexota bacterium]
MNRKVRAAVVVGESKMAIREFDYPVIGSEDGLLRVEMVGVCGTDPKFYSGEVKVAPFPLILGHEVLGWIEEIGDLAAQRWKVKKGDRVVVDSCIRCGYCNRCITGDYRFCEKGWSYGSRISASIPPHLWGGYSEFMYLPPGAVVYKVADSVPATAGILIQAVMANAIRWGRKAGNFSVSDAVLIQGVGQQGLALTIIARESGCNPIIVAGLSRDEERFCLAREFGADFTIDIEKEDLIKCVTEITNGEMADVVVDVAPSPRSIIQAVETVREQGTVVLPTVLGSEVTTSLVTDKIVFRDITIVGQFTSDARTVPKAIKLVESGRYPVERIVSHTFSLDEAETAVLAAGGYLDNVYPIKCAIIPTD